MGYHIHCPKDAILHEDPAGYNWDLLIYSMKEKGYGHDASYSTTKEMLDLCDWYMTDCDDIYRVIIYRDNMFWGEVESTD